MLAFQRFLLAILVVLAVFGAGRWGSFASLDRVALDARFIATNRPASRQAVFVEIDSASLADVGVWPWPRQVHAQVLDRLMELGAANVAFDIDFSTHSTPDGDAVFASALARAGSRAHLATFEQLDGATGERRVNQPIEPFAAAAGAVAVNVSQGQNGLVESFATSLDGVPALAVALYGQPVTAESVNIDFGIDLGTVDRIPVHQVLAGTVDPARIAGKEVVVGASALELRDFFTVPRFGIVPGPMVQLAGFETLKAGRNLIPLGQVPALIVALLLGALWAVSGRISMRMAAIAALSTVVAAEVIALAAQAWFGITARTAALNVAVFLLFGLQLARGFSAEYGKRRRAETGLLYMARHDEATGALSRRGFLEQIEHRPAAPLLLVALQRLELVRGTLGRNVADGALHEVANRIDALTAGTLGMVDRDVFALSLPPGMSAEAISRLGREVRRALRPLLEIDGHEVHVDAVLAAAAPEQDVTAELHLQRAELALESALAQQAGGVTTFVPSMEEDVARRRRIDAALRQAIERRELNVLFQPQALAADGTLVGVEALVRWTSPELGPLSPAEFIPIAEETGLIVPLGRLVLVEACRAAASWDWTGRLAVNVSASQLRLSEVAEMVADGLIETGFDAGRLDLEITESVLVGGPERLIQTLAALKSLGVGIALDDFGTGYSSLSYLSQLSFEKLKIDQSFVRRLGTGAAEDAIVRSVIELARRLGKTTIAEGVETEAQRALLVEMGCDVCQGWLIGKPMPAAEIAARIAASRAA